MVVLQVVLERGGRNEVLGFQGETRRDPEEVSNVGKSDRLKMAGGFGVYRNRMMMGRGHKERGGFRRLEGHKKRSNVSKFLARKEFWLSLKLPKCHNVPTLDE